MKLFPAICPQCSANLNFNDSDEFVVCSHCQTKIYVSKDSEQNVDFDKFLNLFVDIDYILKFQVTVHFYKYKKLEHLYYNFDIDGISRACLQEVARHRLASYTVKSSRYTLQELKKENPFDTFTPDIDWERACKFIVLTNESYVDYASVKALEELRVLLDMNVPNDISKYCMPEAYKTSLVMSVNARSLQNFLELRTSKHALKEIQDLAKALFDTIPNEHKFLFEPFIS